MKSLGLTVRQHLSIVIVAIAIITSSFSLYFTPTVEADLAGPYFIRGYIDRNNNTDIPSGETVTLTNNRNSNSITTTTLSSGAYQANVGKDSGMDCSDGDQIVINCSYIHPAGNEVEENATNININLTFEWCNLTGDARLKPENLSINITPASWDAGTLGYGSYSNTTDTYFNLSNRGNAEINILIQGENFTWDSYQWNLTSTTALNNYTLEYKKSGESWINIGTGNSSFISNGLQFDSSYFSYTHWQLFGFNFSMPTSSSPAPSGSQQFNVTFWSIRA